MQSMKRIDKATFGPGGNSESFYAEGFKSTLQAPSWIKARGLDAYEYQAGNGLTASDATLAAIGKKAAEHGILMSLHTPYYISLSIKNLVIWVSLFSSLYTFINSFSLGMNSSFILFSFFGR